MSDHFVTLGRPTEECGVFGIAGHPEASRLTYLGLHALQHRGQETAGIVSARVGKEGFPKHRVYRGLGLVADVFNRDNLENLRGDVAIGHVRYSTTGATTPTNTQPLVSTLRHGPVAIAHNGNLTNAHLLRHALKSGGAIFQTTIDSEVILHLISRTQYSQFEQCLSAALRMIQGAYSLLAIHGQTIYASRDAHGFRPLALGKLDDGTWVVASESVAFDLINAEFVRDVLPGETVRLVPGEEPVSLRLEPELEPARCIFELVYFARPDSVIDGHAVGLVRERLGAILSEEQPADADVVVSVPDSANAAALGFARAAKIPLEMGLIRNHYVGRTFIEPQQRIRDFGAKIKYNPVRSVVEGKRVVLVDDSIVRGTTSRKIVTMLRQAGATEIHLRITAPPWRNPCHYGIDTPEEEKLIANRRSVEEIREAIGCDTLGFISPEGLTRAAEENEGWCMACFTGEYPGGRPASITKDILERDEAVSDTNAQISRSGMGGGGLEDTLGR